MMLERTAIAVRPWNWLPLPGEGAAEPHVAEDDLFSKGEVVAFYPRQGRGVVRVGSDREYPFDLQEIELVGPKGSPDYLKQGQRVGFDIGRTSRGPRIVQLKIY